MEVFYKKRHSVDFLSNVGEFKGDIAIGGDGTGFA